MRIIRVLLAAFLAAPVAAGPASLVALNREANGAALSRIIVVTEAGGAGAEEVERALKVAGGDTVSVSVIRLPRRENPNPILKGRLLAAVQAAALVIPVGDRATEFILKEREDVPVYFVGAASLVTGRALASPGISGILPYNAGETLDLVQALGLSPLGLACTAGYAEVANVIEAAAKDRGIRVVRRTIDRRAEVGPAVRELTSQTRIVWVLGDPLLTRGAGFSFLIEQSLASRVPIVAPARWEVEQGALVGTEPAWPSLAAAAGDGLRARLASAGTDTARSITLAPPGGMFLLNQTLAEKWGVTPPSGTSWRGVH